MLSNIILRSTAAFGGAPFRLKKCTALTSVGAGAAAVLAMLYKIWCILKVDRKEDSLDNAERKLRDELRDEIKVLKEDIKILSNEVRILRDTHIQCQDENAALKGRIKWLETCLRYCQLNLLLS